MTTLHKLFVRVHTRYTRSLHAADLAAFADWLLAQDYPARYTQRLVFRAMRSLESFDHPPDSIWTLSQLARAFHRRRQRRLYQHARYSFGHYLQSRGRLAIPPDSSPHASVLAAYQNYLVEVRGLQSATVVQHQAEVRALLHQTLAGGKPLNQLTAAAIEQYIAHRARGITRRFLRTSIGYLRAFLRYCYDRQLVKARLDLLEQPVGFRDELPPRALDWRLIQKLLRSVDRTSPGGWRDFMMLHLMAHYGLRPGEVTRLTMDSIHWEARTLLVEQPKTHSWLTLPLLDKTLNLLGRYLREGRRPTRRAELFLNTKAPYGSVSKAGATYVFKSRARKAGLPIAHASPYALRHSFAMRLFSRSVGIKTIGDLMGHNGLASTCVYLRLQTDVLRKVALSAPKAIMPDGGAA